jgi:hypothetical protein
VTMVLELGVALFRFLKFGPRFRQVFHPRLFLKVGPVFLLLYHQKYLQSFLEHWLGYLPTFLLQQHP